MERLLEKSLDDQYAIEQTRQAAEALLNRRLNWVMLPLGIAFAVIAYCLDMSTRIALPVLAELQEASPLNDARHDYDVFRLDLWAFARMVPSALIAGAIGSWFAVLMGTKYGRN